MNWGNAKPNGGVLGAPLENCSKSAFVCGGDFYAVAKRRLSSSKSAFVCRATFMLQQIDVRCTRASEFAPRRFRGRRRSSDVLPRVRCLRPRRLLPPYKAVCCNLCLRRPIGGRAACYLAGSTTFSASLAYNLDASRRLRCRKSWRFSTGRGNQRFALR